MPESWLLLALSLQMVAVPPVSDREKVGVDTLRIQLGIFSMSRTADPIKQLIDFVALSTSAS